MMIPSQNPFPDSQLKIHGSLIFVIQFLLDLQLSKGYSFAKPLVLERFHVPTRKGRLVSIQTSFSSSTSGLDIEGLTQYHKNYNVTLFFKQKVRLVQLIKLLESEPKSLLMKH